MNYRTSILAAATLATAATAFAAASTTTAGTTERETNTYWAVVDPTVAPSLNREQGVEYASTGGSETSVKFERDISYCSYTANVGSPGGWQIQPGFTTVRTSPNEKTVVRVATYDANGNPAILPFHLQVICWDTDWTKVPFVRPPVDEG